MVAQSIARRAAALAAAAKLGPTKPEVADEIKRHRERYEQKRNERPIERRKGEGDRRKNTLGGGDRRKSAEDRRFFTNEDLLAAASAKHDGDRKYSGDPITGFGDSLL